MIVHGFFKFFPKSVIPSVAAAASRILLQPSVASPELAEGEVEESVLLDKS
jgi:hypothetical protein